MKKAFIVCLLGIGLALALDACRGTPNIAPPPAPTLPTSAPNGATARAPTPVGRPPAFKLGFEPILTGFQRPVYVTDAGDGSGRLFVVEQAGRIRVIVSGVLRDTPFLDIVPLVNTSGNERGLLSLAFHPNYKVDGLFFVNYTRQPDGATVIARYRVSRDANIADPDSAHTVLVIEQPEANHNGGLVLFGPDGYLYIGMGDGGGAGDRHGSIGNGQNLNALLGKMLRIDVNREPYANPDSNPFVKRPGARPEIWAYGLRNPWRFSFDRVTQDLYIADVGQNAYEEIDVQPASSPGGENYGWRLMEGNHCHNPSENCSQPGLTLPVAEYGHSQGCSVTGGYVYRGSQYPWLNGSYLFADYCSGRVWSLRRNASGNWEMTERLQVNFTVSSFGEDPAGELYLVGHSNGTIYRLISTPGEN